MGETDAMILLVVLFLLMLSGDAGAQALVVSTCGTPPQAYAVGSTRNMTVDLNGRLCMKTASPAAVCGTLPQPYTPGSTRDVLIDVNGNTCLQGSGSGGGGTTPVVNSVAFQAGAPAVTNQAIGQASATNSPTSWSVTSCAGCTGYFAVDNSGNLTVTSTGAAAITGNNTSTITTFNPVLQATNGNGSGSATMTVNFYADGSTGTVTGTPQFPSLLSGYVKRAPWKVAGVDYQVGVPTGTVLKDPAAGGLPAACNISGQNIFCDGPGSFTLDSWDFSLHGGYQLICDLNGNMTLTNSYFAIGSNGAAMIRTDYNGGCATATFIHDTFDAKGLDDNLNSTNIYSGAVNWTMKYCLIQNAFGDLVDLTTNSTNTMEWNLFYQSGIGVNSHPDWLQLGGGTAYTVTLLYNTYYQPAVTTGPGTQGIMPDGGVVGANNISGNTIVTAAGSQVNFIISALTATGTFLISNNYMDPTGVNNAVYKNVSVQNTQIGNINMKTGGACNGLCPP